MVAANGLLRTLFSIFSLPCGCKHSKVDQESAPVYGSHDFLGQTPISGSKMLFKIFIFS
jgi:hypothetical protein